MGILIHNIIINGKKVKDIYITGPDTEMTEDYINKICENCISDEYKNKPDSFSWGWK